MHYYIDSTLDNIINVKQVKHFYIADSLTNINDHGSRYNFWQIVYLESGSLIEYSENEATILGANDILFHKPGELSGSKSTTSGEATTAYFISFGCQSAAMEFFDGYKSKLSPESIKIMNNIIKEAKNGFDITHIDNFSMVKRLPAAPIGGFQMFKNYMESLMINILREENEKNPNSIFTSKDDFDNSIHQNIEEYLTQNIYEDITLDNICKKLNYSKTFLCSKFKAIEGMSIMNYMNMLKIEEACKLIKSDKYSMAQISNMLKFNNQYYFSRVFKRIKGVTPMDYKKMGQKS